MPRTKVTSVAAESRGSKALAVVLRLEEQGPVAAVEFVSARDLADARMELWFEAFPRCGAFDTPPAAVPVEPRAIHRSLDDGTSVCLGFSLECDGARGERVRCVFPRASLEHVATRATRRLIAAGELDAGTHTFFSLTDDASDGPVPPGARTQSAHQDIVVVQAGEEAEHVPLLVQHTPLAPLLERAEGKDLDLGVAEDFKVFFTREAFAKAERAARRGADLHPAKETGGLLVGPLCSCPQTGELFAVVVDVLEAKHSEATTYTLEFSDKTWARFHAILRAQQAHPPTRHHRFLGQVHGHSFLPMQESNACEECATRAECTRTTAFLSPEDMSWCRAVFHREPWQLSQVFGLDVRGEGAHAFFGQRGGRLVSRAFHLIDDFEASDATSEEL